MSQGGRLLALSYYGGDDHFGTNLHDALAPFGLVLNKDVVVDGNLPFPHPSGEFVTAHPVPGQAFVADGETVHLPWCASVTVDTKVNPAAQPILVSGGDAKCYRLIYAEDEPGRTLDRKRMRTAAPPVAAIATYRANGGRVAAVGSWQAFTDGTLRLPGCANRQFLDRLLTWLLEGADDKG
ncbi:MAG: hypothetical protein IPK16_08310 [Anaerolineales bacterium]|nr:hypothetical protein [Anaerolineales bacterium]